MLLVPLLYTVHAMLAKKSLPVLHSSVNLQVNHLFSFPSNSDSAELITRGMSVTRRDEKDEVGRVGRGETSIDEEGAQRETREREDNWTGRSLHKAGLD